MVSEVLRITTVKDVVIADAFRLGGRFAAGNVRPLLVKLKSAWNRRLVVIGASKLAQCEDLKRVYLSPDEPLDIWRKATFERLQKKRRKRKTISISN